MNARKLIITAAVIAAATSIGVYANGAYAQGQWANSDDQAADGIEAPDSEVAIIGTNCPSLAICNEDGSKVKVFESQSERVAIVGENCPDIPGVVCNENGSITVIDDGAVADQYLQSEDDSLISDTFTDIDMEQDQVDKGCWSVFSAQCW